MLFKNAIVMLNLFQHPTSISTVCEIPKQVRDDAIYFRDPIKYSS